jgi:hypothetical protein
MRNHTMSRLPRQSVNKRKSRKVSLDPQRDEKPSIRMIAPNQNVKCCFGLGEVIALGSLALTYYQVSSVRRLNRAQSRTKPRCPAISSITKKRCNLPLIYINKIDNNGEVFVETICTSNHKRTVPIFEAYNPSAGITVRVRKA